MEEELRVLNLGIMELFEMDSNRNYYLVYVKILFFFSFLQAFKDKKIYKNRNLIFKVISFFKFSIFFFHSDTCYSQKHTN